jgi:hypothetical protein
MTAGKFLGNPAGGHAVQDSPAEGISFLKMVAAVRCRHFGVLDGGLWRVIWGLAFAAPRGRVGDGDRFGLILGPQTARPRLLL